MTALMKTYRIHPTTGSAPDWSMAETLTDFTFPWETTPPPRTAFRALWDSEHLHFRFDCEDTDLVLGQGSSLKERVLGSDRVEIFLAPDLSLNPYYCFEMSPQGEALAYRGQFHRQFDWDWTCPELQITAALAATSYWVAGRLPLATLRRCQVLQNGQAGFHAGVYRGEFSHRADGSVHMGWLPWVPPGTERPDFHVPGSFGRFELVGWKR
jgi:Carbohydrate family 9 binding domain-like